MSPTITFLFGLLLLGLFGWYFMADTAGRKRAIGLALTLLLVAFCIEAIVPPEKKIRLGLDLQGGTSFLLRLVGEGGQEITPATLEQAIEVIRKRVDQFGVSEPVIAAQGRDRILVQIPGLDTQQLAQTKDQLQRVAKLEFSLVHPQSESVLAQVDAGEAVLPPGYILKEYSDVIEGKEKTIRLLVKQRPDLTGDRVTSAHPFYDNQGYGVAMKLDGDGAKMFGDLTTAHVGDRLAIMLDGDVQSAPNIRQPIYGGEAVITGRFTDKEARNLASVLENPLRTPVQIEETRSVSASLGADSIRSGIGAGLLGLALTLVFVLFYYRLAGLVACLALAVNLVMLFGAMCMFNFVLTLPGIAGIILTIGMAIDANVLIYERLREEMAAGKSLATAVNSAYDKAFSAIFDANLTTLITSAILFWQATGPVKGFAITLTLGIIASMFSALLFTRTCFGYMLENFGLKKLRMRNWIPAHKIDFLGKRHVALALSGILILGSIGFFAWRGEKNFGVDFTGGDLVVLASKEQVPLPDLRRSVESAGVGETTLQTSIDEGRELVTVQSRFGTAEAVVAKLRQDFPSAQWVTEQTDTVGPRIGRELAGRSLFALALGLLGIFVYVTVRFEFSFALGAIVALLHDVIITVGVFSILGREISLVMVGAVLTIAGYSINDTIVVFDRVREGLMSGRRGSVAQIMNECINETLGRTILTGGTTLLATAALFFLGGPVLSDFALAILIGILVGTYSSIYVAAPIVLWWAKRTGKSIKREVLGDLPQAAA
ncbi:MAG: protein translocase subunit SecD, partial [Chthoniobacterales bacterium]|nr:protein translocase subunit SecD [Chthoniobacterales bacterium]